MFISKTQVLSLSLLLLLYIQNQLVLARGISSEKPLNQHGDITKTLSTLMSSSNDAFFDFKIQRNRINRKCLLLDMQVSLLDGLQLSTNPEIHIQPTVRDHHQESKQHPSSQSHSVTSKQEKEWLNSDIIQVFIQSEADNQEIVVNELHTTLVSHGYCTKMIVDDDEETKEDVYMTDVSSLGALPGATYIDGQVEKIIDGGPSENRIDVVFMGDGYTRNDKDKFFSDIRRLIEDMWSDTTFAPYLPVFNIWAVFVPSIDKGIGVNGKSKNTAIGLYRDGTELRGIYCSKPHQAREACKLTGPYACDFPSLIANDDYYGGLGGEFTISTRSIRSGTIVLRHELGHNLIKVGEEYDGGYVYSGVNSAKSLMGLKWSHWLTNETTGPREEALALRLEEYVWYDLQKGPKTFNFKSDGKYSRFMMRMSISGIEESDAIKIILDGEPLPFKSYGGFDRQFFEFKNDQSGLSAGMHNLTVLQTRPPVNASAPIRQYCSVSLHEYAAESEFHMADPSYISAYPTFSINGLKSYRPTNEYCLMRNMTSREFCSVCKEGMWERFLGKVSLIDKLELKCNSKQDAQLTATVLPLGQLRKDKHFKNLNETLFFSWRYKGQVRSEFDGKLSIPVDLNKNAGDWSFKVKFESSMIRKNIPGAVRERKFEVTPEACAAF